MIMPYIYRFLFVAPLLFLPAFLSCIFHFLVLCRPKTISRSSLLLILLLIFMQFIRLFFLDHLPLERVNLLFNISSYPIFLLIFARQKTHYFRSSLPFVLCFVDIFVFLGLTELLFFVIGFPSVNLTIRNTFFGVMSDETSRFLQPAILGFIPRLEGFLQANSSVFGPTLLFIWLLTRSFDSSRFRQTSLKLLLGLSGSFTGYFLFLVHFYASLIPLIRRTLSRLTHLFLRFRLSFFLLLLFPSLIWIGDLIRFMAGSSLAFRFNSKNILFLFELKFQQMSDFFVDVSDMSNLSGGNDISLPFYLFWLGVPLFLILFLSPCFFLSRSSFYLYLLSLLPVLYYSFVLNPLISLNLAILFGYNSTISSSQYLSRYPNSSCRLP